MLYATGQLFVCKGKIVMDRDVMRKEKNTFKDKCREVDQLTTKL